MKSELRTRFGGWMGVLTRAAAGMLLFCAVSAHAQQPGVSNAAAQPAALAETAPQGLYDAKTIRIHDSGSMRTFRVALDEVGVFSGGKPRARRTITAAADVQSLVGVAAARRAAAGEEMDLVLYEDGAKRDEYTCRYLTRDVRVGLKPGVDIEKVCKAVNGISWRPTPATENYYYITVSGAGGALDAAQALLAVDGVIDAQPQLAKQLATLSLPNPTDTYYSKQWPLRNTGQSGGTAGIDVNITNAWPLVDGNGIKVGIVDDSLQTAHPDFTGNINTSIDKDFNGDDYDPNPSPTNATDFHGTAVAGLVAANDNGTGVVGSAPGAEIVGIRLLGQPATDEEEAGATLHKNDEIEVKNNSWGVSGWSYYMGPGPEMQNAMSNAATTGRKGLGTIMVWAAGNNDAYGQNVNHSGYANSVYGIAVGAIGRDGTKSSYSEQGACLLVSAPSRDNWGGIYSTDRTGQSGYNCGTNDGCKYYWSYYWEDGYYDYGYWFWRLYDWEITNNVINSDYTETFGGTSASAPIVSGIVALMLEANGDLGLRDVQEILIQTSKQNSPLDSDWKVNAAGFHFNHKYGAGLVDAGAAVRMAQGWQNLSPQVVKSFQTNVSLGIPDSSATGAGVTFSPTNILRVEHVAVTLNITHPMRNQLSVVLTAPSGMTSTLMHYDESYDETNDLAWTFTSVRHWGETSKGTWTVKVLDNDASAAGTLTFAKLTLYCSTNTPAEGGGGGGTGTVGTPTGVAASDNTFTDKIRVTWNAATEATSYEVWRATSASSGSATKIGDANASPYDDTTAVAGTTYYYWVKAKNATGTSGFSNWDSGMRAIQPPIAPTGVTASDNIYSDKVLVSWTAASGATAYEVWRSETDSTSTAFRVSGTDPTGISYSDALATPGVIYYYWVKAKNSAGTSGYSTSDAGQRKILVPDAPTGVVATDGTYTNKVRVFWNEVAGVNSYELWRGTTDTANGSVLVMDSLVVLMYDDVSAVAGSTYYYRVRAVLNGVPSDFSTSDSGYRQPGSPATPGSVSATDGTLTDRVRVTWGAVTEATSYEVWRNTVNNNALATRISDSPTASYDDMTAQVGATYYYWVKAKNAYGVSGFSGVAAGYVQAAVLYRVIQLEGDLSFGSIPVGQNASRVVTIRSVGDAALQVYSLSLPAGFSGSFSGSIPAAGSTNVTLYFRPVDALCYSGTFTVNSDAGAGANSLSMIGYGLPPLRTVGYSDTLGMSLIHNGTNGLVNEFQYSGDLKSWITLYSFTGNISGVTLQDNSATNAPFRYYRVYRAP